MCVKNRNRFTYIEHKLVIIKKGDEGWEAPSGVWDEQIQTNVYKIGKQQ